MSEPRKSHDQRPLIIIGVTAFLIGICLALAVNGIFLTARFALPRLVKARPTTLPNTPSPATPTATPHPSLPPNLPTPTPTDAGFQKIWAEAESYSTTHAPEKVLELILPMLAQLKQPDDLTRAYYYLGQAESQLGHFQLAAVYFEKLYAYQKTAENLLALATAYDLGGDLDHALERYTQLSEWSGPEGDVYRERANARVRSIIEIIGTPTPKP